MEIPLTILLERADDSLEGQRPGRSPAATFPRILAQVLRAPRRRSARRHGIRRNAGGSGASRRAQRRRRDRWRHSRGSPWPGHSLGACPVVLFYPFPVGRRCATYEGFTRSLPGILEAAAARPDRGSTSISPGQRPGWRARGRFPSPEWATQSSYG